MDPLGYQHGSGKPAHPWSNRRFIVKVDPDRRMTEDLWRELQQCRPDLLLVGGTQNITFEKVVKLLEEIDRWMPGQTVWQEISGLDSIFPGLPGYAVPCVLNSSSPRWMIGAHAEAIERLRTWIPWERVLVEGYLVLNPDSAVGQLTEALCLPPAAAAAFAEAAERLWKMQTVYVEYSGVWGDMEVVRKIRRSFSGHLIYGGGVSSVRQAAEAAGIADSVVVGNALYEQPTGTLAAIGTAIRKAQPGGG